MLDTRISHVYFLWLLKYAILACGLNESSVVTNFIARVYHNKNNILHCSSCMDTIVGIMGRQFEYNTITMMYTLRALLDLICVIYVTIFHYLWIPFSNYQ